MAKEELLEKIEAKRNELHDIIKANGLSSRITIEYSQQLDRLLNQFDKNYY